MLWFWVAPFFLPAQLVLAGDIDDSKTHTLVVIAEISDSIDDSAVFWLSEPDTVFIRSRLEDGKLSSEDLAGRRWEYNERTESFVLLDDLKGELAPVISSMMFISGDDTIIVTRDRSADWATEPIKAPRYSSQRIRISIDEVVTGNITSPEKVIIEGLVEGDVFSLSSIVITKTGVVNGDVRAPKIRVRSGGMVTGAEIESVIGFADELDDEFGQIINLGAFATFAIVAGALLLVAFLSISLAPRSVELAAATIANYPWRTMWTGLLVTLALGPAVAIVAVTVVGIPLALALVVAFPAALLVGIVAFSQHSGAVSLAAYGKEPGSALRRITVGILILMGLWAVAISLNESSSDMLSGWGIFLTVIVAIYSFVAAFSGIGAVAMTRFGRREYTPHTGWKSKNPPPPAPPPMPNQSTPPGCPAPPAPPAPPPLPSSPSLPGSRQSE